MRLAQVPDPRQGRAGQSGFSPRLGRKDPRWRTNQAGLVADADLDQKTLGRDGVGRTRVTAADGMKPLKSDASLAEVIAHLNALQAKLRGQ